MYNHSTRTAQVLGLITATIPTIRLYQAVTLLSLVPLFRGIFCIVLGLFASNTSSPLARHVGWIAFVLILLAVLLPC
jgi:hypothetical protein